MSELRRRIEEAAREPGHGPGTNTGHGHVWPRPDGVRARCGGTRLCTKCRDDAERWPPPRTHSAPPPPPAPSRPGLRRHVRCVNLACDDPADTEVTLEQIAPGVVRRGDYQCAACGFSLVVA